MSSFVISPCKRIKGNIALPGDKSISHRALIFSSLSQEKTIIKNFPFSDDCLVTLKAFRSMGIKIRNNSSTSIVVEGKGLFGLIKPKSTLYFKESGTTMRLLTGLLSGQSFSSRLDGSPALRKRPMLRVINPLSLMGAKINAKKRRNNFYLPISISPNSLESITWKMKIPSAQVKSAILLAGLYAKGKTIIYEPISSRDHTERMMSLFKARIKKQGKKIYLESSLLIAPKIVEIPGDISSASFFIVLAVLKNKSQIKIKKVSLNLSRLGVIDVLKKMGASIKVTNKRIVCNEPIGDLIIRSSILKGVTVRKSVIPRLIDELPILMVAASLARGKSSFEGVRELRVKETDRIRSMVENLRKMGVLIEIKHKGNKEVIVIEGRKNLRGASLKSFNDHRTAMSMVVAGLLAQSQSLIDDMECVNKSFPQFFPILNHLIDK